MRSWCAYASLVRSWCPRVPVPWCWGPVVPSWWPVAVWRVGAGALVLVSSACGLWLVARGLWLVACGLWCGPGVVRLCPSLPVSLVPWCGRSLSSVVQGVGCLSFDSGPMASEPAPGLGFARFLLRTCKVGRGPCNDLLNDAGPWNRANRLYSAFQKSVVTNLNAKSPLSGAYRRALMVQG